MLHNYITCRGKVSIKEGQFPEYEFEDDKKIHYRVIPKVIGLYYIQKRKGSVAFNAYVNKENTEDIQVFMEKE